ncbi:hypothetical protein FRC05_005307 [Tulasnella sp. 425]|nr:hypothetical protein FRC05_005307 [Tulasnella sp. 425]
MQAESSIIESALLGILDSLGSTGIRNAHPELRFWRLSFEQYKGHTFRGLHLQQSPKPSLILSPTPVSWMIVTVRNDTPFPIVLDSTLFHPGKYVTEPVTPILPEQSTTYELGSSNIGGGINGGNAWIVELDNGVTWSFATGWIATVFPGPNKAGVAESSDPQAGNSAATPEGNSIISTDTFQDKDGQDIKLTASATPNMEFETLFVVGTATPN